MSNSYFDASKVRLRKFHYEAKEEVAKINETPDMMEINSPILIAHATLVIPPFQENVELKFGWISVCTKSTCIHKYGKEGVASWEVPELMSGKYKMVNTTPNNTMPWFNNNWKMVQGPTQHPTTIHLQFRYEITSSALYNIPNLYHENVPKLTFMYQKEVLNTYLVLEDVKNKHLQTITAIDWSLEMAIDIDLEKPLGKQSEFLGPCVQKKPSIILKNLVPLLERNIYDTTMWKLNLYLWRPKAADPQLSLIPEESTMFIKQYMEQSKCYTEELLKITQNTFLLKEKMKMKKRTKDKR